MNETQLKEIVEDTLDWAGELSEAWAGTTTGRIIDSQKTQLQQSVDNGNMQLASVQVLELGQTCDYAAKEIDE